MKKFVNKMFFMVVALVSIMAVSSTAYAAEDVPNLENCVYTNDGVYKIDYTVIEDGTVEVLTTATTKTKVAVKYHTSNTVEYFTIPANEVQSIPVVKNEQVSILVYQNTTGNKYKCVLQKQFDSFEYYEACFVNEGNYVQYGEKTVEIAKTLVGKDDYQTVLNVFNYTRRNMSYDYNKAATIKNMYTPDTDKALEMKKGICFDYAAVVATMLRSQNIPTKLVFGYAPNGEYHSWNEVFVNGTWMHLDATWGRMNSTGYTVSTIH